MLAVGKASCRLFMSGRLVEIPTRSCFSDLDRLVGMEHLQNSPEISPSAQRLLETLIFHTCFHQSILKSNCQFNVIRSILPHHPKSTWYFSCYYPTITNTNIAFAPTARNHFTSISPGFKVPRIPSTAKKRTKTSRFLRCKVHEL